MNWHFAYKVVKVERSFSGKRARRYFSAVAHLVRWGEPTEYFFDAETKPHALCGPLTVFTSRKSAQRFLSIEFPGDKNHIITGCWYQVARPSYNGLAVWGPRGKGWGMDLLPQGTALASKVILTRFKGEK